MKIALLIGKVVAVLSLMLLVWVGAAHFFSPTPAAVQNEEYLKTDTIRLAKFTDDQGSDTAVSGTFQRAGSDVMFVKVKHINNGGSGGYVTAMTMVPDLRPGDRLNIKTVHILNNVEVSVLVAEKAPTPRGH